MVLSDGVTYGFAHEGKIFLNPDVISSEAAVHEYTHLWDNYTQRTNPDLWNKGLDIFRGTSLWNDVLNDQNYADIKDDENLVLSECHARICGKIADAALQKVLERDGDLADGTYFINDCKTMLKNIGSKLKAMGVNSEDDAAIFSQNAARKIRGIDADISALISPEHVKEVTEAWNLKLMEERVIKSNRAHTGHLAESILNNLYPFSVTEERVQNERWNAAQKYRDTDPERFAKAKDAWEKYQEKKSGPAGTGAGRENPAVSGSGDERPAQEAVPAREAVEKDDEKKRKPAVPFQSQSGSGQLSFF